mmetsp:Transcript_38530/g.98500  ORF Transcript_38530/g.98500 Transcript_38530/m.98500 type:complete len:281 (+) Transcript_38530:1332-2174(+)
MGTHSDSEGSSVASSRHSTGSLVWSRGLSRHRYPSKTMLTPMSNTTGCPRRSFQYVPASPSLSLLTSKPLVGPWSPPGLLSPWMAARTMPFVYTSSSVIHTSVPPKRIRSGTKRYHRALKPHPHVKTACVARFSLWPQHTSPPPTVKPQLTPVPAAMLRAMLEMIGTGTWSGTAREAPKKGPKVTVLPVTASSTAPPALLPTAAPPAPRLRAMQGSKLPATLPGRLLQRHAPSPTTAWGSEVYPAPWFSIAKAPPAKSLMAPRAELDTTVARKPDPPPDH